MRVQLFVAMLMLTLGILGTLLACIVLSDASLGFSAGDWSSVSQGVAAFIVGIVVIGVACIVLVSIRRH